MSLMTKGFVFRLPGFGRKVPHVFVAASTICFSDANLSDACQFLADLEYDSVELWLSESSPQAGPSEVAADPDAFVTQFHEITRLTPVAFRLTEDVAPETFVGISKTAKLLQVTQITVPSSPLGTPFNEEIDRLKALVHVASRDGIRVSIKTEGGRLTADHDTAVELCGSVRGLGLTLDPSYYLSGPNPVTSFERFAPHVNHVHLRDSTPSELAGSGGAGRDRLQQADHPVGESRLRSGALGRVDPRIHRRRHATARNAQAANAARLAAVTKAAQIAICARVLRDVRVESAGGLRQTVACVALSFTEAGMVVPDSLNEFLAEIPEPLKPRFLKIAVIVDRFCDERLNDDYLEVCRRLLACFCQPGTGIERGKPESWAAGIVYEAGQLNFLTDPATQPCVPSEDVARGCGVSPATMHNKGKAIREVLDLSRWDTEFALPNQSADQSLAVLPNGMFVDARYLTDKLHGEPRAADWRKRKAGGSHQNHSGTFYTLKIALNHIEPQIWRRVRLPDVALADLHDVIQVAMGWDDYHLHEFRVGRDRYQPPPPAHKPAFGWDGADETLSTDDFHLSDVVPQGKSKKRFHFRYLYDFGDSWEHTITVEKVEVDAEGSMLPVCLDGERACPPEDCGGVWGYPHLLEALGNRKHPEHAELKEWIGGRFDPEKFSAAKVNEAFSRWKVVT